MTRPTPIDVRLWRLVDRGSADECWPWIGSTNQEGYGHIRKGGKYSANLGVHRVAYELLVGPIPDGLEIDHLCRNTRCVNPAHLEPVSSMVNAQRGRVAKLNPDDVRTIRAHYATGNFTQRALGRMYGVSDVAISMIVRGKRWPNVAMFDPDLED